MRLPKLDRILSADGELQPLVAKARELSALAGLVDGFLPPELAQQIRVANLREGELVLTAANSSAASKLKLLSPSLCRFLIEKRKQVNSVSVRVQPNAPQKGVAAARKTAYFSTHTLDSLHALHDSLGPSPARDALGRLLHRHDPKRAAAPPPQKAAGPAAGRRRRT